MRVKEYDAVVIGAGSGLRISYYGARAKWKKVALIEAGAFGGTCLNKGCIPSKMLIHCAEVMDVVKKSSLFGVKSKVMGVDWKTIQKRVWGSIDPHTARIEKSNIADKNIDVYKERAVFVGKKKIKVGNKVITGKHVFICVGTRPFIPPIPGLMDVHFLTSDQVLRLKKQPKEMVIIGGGYIGCELGYFFSALGTKVTIIDRGDMLIKREDSEIARFFTEKMGKRCTLLLNAKTNSVSEKKGKVILDLEVKGKKKVLKTECLFVATGRKPNTDLLLAEECGVKISKRGYVVTDDYMQTNVKGVWAIGDVAGKHFFKHSANVEADVALHNALGRGKRKKADYSAMPHAIFGSPQIGSVGYTEEQLIEKKIGYVVGKHQYMATGMGKAMGDDGFVKLLVDKKKKKILGCHAIGGNASAIIHEVILAMRHGLSVKDVAETIHIHPALSEVVQRAFVNVLKA